MISCTTPSAVISLDNILYNIQQLRSVLPSGTGIIAVVKDSCYGNGMQIIARVLHEQAQIDYFAVASTFEAIVLRNSGISGKILILGKVTDADLETGYTHNLIFNCTDPDDLDRWKAGSVPVRFHAEIDTGMCRLGLHPDTAAQMLASALRESSHLKLCGVFTHMTSADVPATPTVDEQYNRFASVIAALEKNNINPGDVHIANSATICRFPRYASMYVRPGIALYGCKPDPLQTFIPDFRPAISLHGSVISCREVSEDTPVSYGGHYRTRHRTAIATIGIGYAHGVPRYLSNKGNVLIHGKKYPIAGNVTMDYIMVDVGCNSGIKIGDEAVVMGSQGDCTITADDIALYGNTIGYEVLCNIGPNVRHIYTLHNRPYQTVEPYIY